ncbi:retrovirus-related pol polyprotein from transposon TNT 1-94 [Tanacetum coccineum]
MHNNIMAVGSKDRPLMLGPRKIFTDGDSRISTGFYSRDGESMVQITPRFYKLMNELTRNNLQVTTMQVNVQFLQQLQQMQYQNEVNDIRAERIAKSANPLALLAAAQPYSDNYYQAPKPQRTNTTSSSTRPSASTRHKGKEIAKPVTPQSESVSEEDSDPKQAQRDKDMQKNSGTPWNKTEDTTPRYNNDNQSGLFGNQRTMTVDGAKETVGSQVVQQNGIQCFNYKGFGHYAKECRKPKRVKDCSYHKEKMMMCKQVEHGVPLQAEQVDWLVDTDEEIDEQELEAHSVHGQIQEVLTEDPVQLNTIETGLLALKDIEIKEGLKTKAYEISVLNQKHDELVNKSLLTKSQFEGQTQREKYLKDVNARTKKPKVVPISASKPKRKANKSVATPHKKTVASDTTIQKSKSYHKELYENTNQEWKWWIAKRCPSGYKWTQKPLRTKKIWMPKIRKEDVSTSISPTIDIVSRITNIVQLILFIVDSGCTKHMTGNLKLLCNFVEKFLGTVRFGNDQFAPILGYGDLNQGNVTIKRVYYVEGLNHNLFSVGQFCDADLEVAFRKSTCFVRDLQGNDLLTGNRGSDLYTISLQETTSSTPICFMAKASPTQAWLWHRRLSHLNFDYITLLSKKDIMTGLPKLKYVKDQLCSSCKMSKAKRSSFKSKVVPSSKGRLNLLHMDLCGPMRDETPEVLKDFLTMIQRNLQAQVISVHTDRGTEFLNKTLHAYFKEEGIEHQTSTPRTPEQNGVVERRNRTLVEAARTMLSASKLPLSFWAEAVATAYYTQNISIIISTHRKMAYHIINDRKPSIKHLHIFGCICYITRDGENLDKMKEKGDPCVMVGYSTQSKGYRVYNKRTRLIVESIHIKFDEIKEMMSDHNSLDLAPQRQEMSVENVSLGLVPQGQKASDYDNSGPVPPRQNVVPTAEKTDSSQQGLEFLFSPLLEEYYNPAHGHAEDNNNDQAPNASFQEAEFINPFCTRVQEIGESSSRNIDNTDVHSFQPQSHDYRWTRDHPLEQVRGNPTMPVQTRRQLATDPEMCMFALTVSIVEPKNIKEAMADSAWIEAMQDELHQFDRLKVWELVDKPFGKMIIKLKWLWKNKKDEDQTVIRNKARLVTQQVFSNSNLIWTCENAFLNGPLMEEVYVAQPRRGEMKDEKFFDRTPGSSSPKRPDLGTINMGLWYPKDSGFELTAFSDADHAGCLDIGKHFWEDTVLVIRLSQLGCQRNKTALQCLQQSRVTFIG